MTLPEMLDRVQAMSNRDAAFAPTARTLVPALVDALRVAVEEIQRCVTNFDDDTSADVLRRVAERIAEVVR